jgi:hypothetical protein
MTILYKRNVAVFDGAVSVEDAEDLLQWMQKHPKAKGDFSDCTHIHLANLQVLMAARIQVAAWPKDDNLTTWLHAALSI